MASGVSTEGVRALALMRWRLKAMAAAVRGLCSPPPGVERSDQSSAQPDLPPAAACGQSRLAPLKAGARSNRRAFSTDTDADLRVPGCAAYFAYADAAGNSDESAGNVPSTNPVGAGATALPPARAAAPRSRCSPTALPLTPTPTRARPGACRAAVVAAASDTAQASRVARPCRVIARARARAAPHRCLRR